MRPLLEVKAKGIFELPDTLYQIFFKIEAIVKKIKNEGKKTAYISNTYA
jgi:hypothetical protein